METSAPVLGHHHVAIRTRDWDETNSFYQDALGYTHSFGWDFEGGRAAFLEAADGSSIEIFEFREPTSLDVPDGPIMHHCVLTDDMDAVYIKLTALGMKVIREPHEGTITPNDGGEAIPTRACFFEGPNGEWIEFKQTQ